jgi:hypothetical protein
MPQPIVSATLVRLFGVILCALIVLALGLPYYSKNVKKRKYPERAALPGGLSKPMLALELVRSQAEVEEVLGKDTDESNIVMRNMLKEDLKGDSYAFIPTYWLLFVAMSWLLAHRHWDWAMWMGIAAGACITGAAIFDYLENSRMSAVLETSISNTNKEMALAISTASLIKWGLIFLATALLSALFWRHNWIGLITILYILSAVVGFAGLIHRPAIEWSSYLTAIATILVAVIFSGFPEKFLRDF